MSKRTRLDVECVTRGLFGSREKAQRAILAGQVWVNNQRVDKPGTSVKTDAVIENRSRADQYVSRGAYKLETALDTFEIDTGGMECLDIGSSTGGFTDCLLQRGARAVTCVDVGRGQLHWKLRQDERVDVHEGVNARNLDTYFDPPRHFDLTVTDVSFISLRLIIPPALTILRPGSPGMIALIKPQFEAGREQIGKGGIVRNEAVHKQVVTNLQEWLEQHSGGKWKTAGLVPSKITGQDGNQEYLWWFRNAGDS